MDDIVVPKRQYKMDMQEIWSLVHTLHVGALLNVVECKPSMSSQGGGY